MGKGWLGNGTEWLGPPRGCRGGDREAQTRRQVDKRRLARAAAREAEGKPKSKGGRPQGPQKRRCSKTTGVLPAKRSQNQKAAWTRRRLRGKQPPLGMTAFARLVHAKAIHAKAVADRVKAVADQAKAAETEALVAAAEAEARAQAAETARQQADDAARKTSRWAAAEARRTSRIRHFLG